MSADPTALYSRKNPFPGKLTVNRKLTAETSQKETRHFEISLAGSELNYEVGDSLGIFPTNCPQLVEEILHSLGLTGDEQVLNPDKQPTQLRAALLKDYVITTPSKQLIEAIVAKAAATPLLSELILPERKKDLEEYLWGMEVIDFLLEHPSVKFTADEFIAVLRKLQPRLYSISSSLNAYPEQVHLTIAAVRYESHGRQRKGVASTFLCDRVTSDVPVPVFVHTAKGFRLPEDKSLPVIMVGPGTGVAPFRAMVQEREVTGATGKNWLFFGEQRSASDFFYKEEWEAAMAKGVLTKLTTAFSRDQEQKMYVQHRMLENAPEIWSWLEEGAHFFVCGDGARMAKDVDFALSQIVEKQGGKTPEEAALYMEQLRKEKRYKRDVY
ncbi:MAG TPA: sulfite reductase subunit alpha [Chthoniobacterales bacterium]|jgi:sulfite reductase (NADPH) flavoprotein alpha-component